MPTVAIATRRADPPDDTNGSGSPFVGKSPTTTARSTAAWVAEAGW